jgi:hypothetical protein
MTLLPSPFALFFVLFFSFPLCPSVPYGLGFFLVFFFILPLISTCFVHLWFDQGLTEKEYNEWEPALVKWEKDNGKRK